MLKTKRKLYRTNKEFRWESCTDILNTVVRDKFSEKMTVGLGRFSDFHTGSHA